MNNPSVKKHFSIVEDDGTQTDFISIDHSKSPDCCELCGVAEELRPYGPGGKWVCFDCMMKDEENAERIFHKILVDPVK